MVGTVGVCSAVCSGFRSLRSECIKNPCLADTLCYGEPGADLVAAGAATCAEWCCESHSGVVFGMVFFVSAALFLLACAYYLWRLHQVNEASGANAGLPKGGAPAKQGGAKATNDRPMAPIVSNRS